MKAVILSYNWNTHAMLHSPFEGDSVEDAERFFSSIKPDFPKEDGWVHVLVRDEEAGLKEARRLLGIQQHH